MEWIGKRLDRLFELYERYVEDLQADLVAANRSLGSTDPKKTWLAPFTRKQFEAFLSDEPADQEIRRLWILRIVRGHENEFPELQATAIPQKTHDSARDSPPGSRHRAKGA